MSVEPRNGLWNRLLARAEARAREESPPETHHYRPLSGGDDHLRASLENSLIYHGLKIETDFNLRLQRPPRKRKTKRKGDLRVAERLRNDRAAAGSPGPTHRTPSGTPARRVSKTTPLSRPLIPPAPSLPPIPAAARAAAHRERVLNAVNDDDEPPVRGRGPVAELSDSSEDGAFLARTTKPDGGKVIILRHFDEAANSNDTSSWEDHAILVEQPPSKEQSSDEDLTTPPERIAIIPTNKSPGLDRGSPHKRSKQDRSQDTNTRSKTTPTRDAKTPSDMSPVLDLRPAYKTSKQDRARRAKARKIANSDSSPVPDSDSGKSRSEKDSGDEVEELVPEFKESLENAEGSDMKTGPMSKRQKEVDSSKRVGEESKGETSKDNDKSGSMKASKESDHSRTPCPRNTLLTETLLARLKKLATKESDGPRSPLGPDFSLNSSSDEGRPTPLRRLSPPMRALEQRRRSPSDMTVEDKLFGPLSTLGSPRRRTRSLSEVEKHLSQSDGDSSLLEVTETTSPKRRNSKGSNAASGSPRSRTKSPKNYCVQEVLQKSPRRSRRNQENRRRDCELEVIATGPADVNGALGKQDTATSAPSHQGPQRKTVRKSAPRGPSLDSWEDSLGFDPINVDVPLPQKTRAKKSSPASSLSRFSGDSDTANRKNANTRSRKRTRPGLISIENASTTDEDKSDDLFKGIPLSGPKSRPLKLLRTKFPISNSPLVTDKGKKPTASRGKPSFGGQKTTEATNVEMVASSSREVQEIHDSDSDICIASFSPAKAKCSTAGSPHNRDQRDSYGQGKRKKKLIFKKRENERSSSDDSDISLTRKSRKEVKRTVRTSPRHRLPIRIRSLGKTRQDKKESLIISDSDDLSDGTFGVSWLENDKKTDYLPKNGGSKRRSPKRGNRGNSVGEGPSRGVSVSEAENSDSCIDVDCPLGVKEGSKESSRKKKRRR